MGVTETKVTNMTVLNTNEAANYITLAAGTLERLRVQGSGPRYLKLGRSVRYRQTDLDQWMESRLTNSTSEQAA